MSLGLVHREQLLKKYTTSSIQATIVIISTVLKRLKIVLKSYIYLKNICSFAVLFVVSKTCGCNDTGQLLVGQEARGAWRRSGRG